MTNFLNFLIGNYTNPIEYKNIFQGISFKLPYFTNIKYINLNRISISLLNFNFPNFNNLSINYLLITNKINIKNNNIEEIIKDLLEFISYPTPEGYKLYTFQLNKILQNPNFNNFNNVDDSFVGKTIEINLGFDTYLNNPLQIISEKLPELRFLSRNQFIFKSEIGIKFINKNELIIYILLSDTFFNDINKVNWYKNFVLNSIKIENTIPYIKYPIKINNKSIGSINLIKNEINNNFTLFNLINYKLYYNILTHSIILQNGEIIFHILNTYSNSQIMGEFSNYLGKNNIGFYFNPIYNLNDIINMIIYFFSSYLNLKIIPENIYSTYIDDLTNYIAKINNMNPITLVIVFSNSDKSIKGVIFLSIVIVFHKAFINYQILSYNSNTQLSNSIININTFDDFLILSTNILNSLTYETLFNLERINYIINMEKIELEKSRTTSSYSKELSDIIYNEIKKENQHRSNLYNKLRQSNEYSSQVFREIQKGFSKDQEAFTKAFSAAINNETYAKDPITNEIYRVPASSGFDNVEYYRDNYNYYSIPDIFQVKSYDYQTQQYLESLGYKKMKTDKFGFVYEDNP